MLGGLAVAVPGAAFASHELGPVSSTIVEGHTVFAAVEQSQMIEFAAVAGIAAKRTTIGGVLWFNNQQLVSSNTASELAAGYFLIATPAGQDPPAAHMDASYAESYQFVDPNGVAWVVDRYTYEECYMGEGAEEVEVPCAENGEGEAANSQVDSDLNGHPDDLDQQLDPADQDADGDGDDDVGPLGLDPNAERVRVETFDLYVVEIGATVTDAATTCGPATGQDYNFVVLVRLDRFGVKSPDAFGGHTGHTHDTASLDLWFSEDRPLETPNDLRKHFWQPTMAPGACA